MCRLAAQKGAEVTIIGRTNRDPGVDRIKFTKADLSLMREAKTLGESDALSPNLDVLLFTTGIIAAPKRQVSFNIMLDVGSSAPYSQFLDRRSVFQCKLDATKAGLSAARVVLLIECCLLANFESECSFSRGHHSCHMKWQGTITYALGDVIVCAMLLVMLQVMLQLSNGLNSK